METCNISLSLACPCEDVTGAPAPKQSSDGEKEPTGVGVGHLHCEPLRATVSRQRLHPPCSSLAPIGPEAQTCIKKAPPQRRFSSIPFHEAQGRKALKVRFCLSGHCTMSPAARKRTAQALYYRCRFLVPPCCCVLCFFIISMISGSASRQP